MAPPSVDLWPWILEERASVLATFEVLDDQQLDTPSLCAGWTVRQVLAHLVLAAHPPVRRYAVALLRARGSFDQANHELAVADAQLPVAELLARYRTAMEHRFAPPGWPPAAPLADVLLHALDVRIPLDLPTDRPAERYEPVLRLLTSPAGKAFAPGSRPAVRWEATDHDWSAGDGPLVQGAMADVALAASGRSARLDALGGGGVADLRTWLA